jgi:hypothetical protein
VVSNLDQANLADDSTKERSCRISLAGGSRGATFDPVTVPGV